MNNSAAFSIFTVFCTDHLCLVPKHFHHTKIDLPPLQQIFPILSSLQPLAITNFFLWMCLFSSFHINRIGQYVTFCVCFLSISLMLLKFIHTVSVLHSFFFLMFFLLFILLLPPGTMPPFCLSNYIHHSRTKSS